MSSGVLILLHPIIAPIGESDAIQSLPSPLREAPRRIVTLAPVQIDLRAIESVDWQDAQARQERAFRESLKPVMDANPGFRLHYFGMAPIPLAMHLGYLVGDLSRTEIHLLRHAPPRQWIWAPDDTPMPALLSPKPLPETRAEGDVVIRVSVSHRVDPMDTRAVVPRPLAEIDLGLEVPDEDALRIPAHLDAVALQFDRAIDDIVHALPNAERIHVFAAVPVGLAFRLGGRPNPTIHPPFVTYQYIARRKPRHERAFILQHEQAPSITLTDADRASAQALRGRAAHELDLIRRFGAAQTVESKSWWQAALPEPIAPDPFANRWRALAPLRRTCLMDTCVDRSDGGDDESFQLKEGKWKFRDILLGAICRRLADPVRQDRAMRMFLFHEGIHQTGHGFTWATAREMRPFPRVLEELDYQADVWAMVHEYAFSHWDSRRPALPDAKSAFSDLIATAIETFWAFDDYGVLREAFEIRRINRYLIWYWQSLRMSRARSLGDALRILAERPYLEIAGPRTRLVNNRVVHLLETQDLERPEIAVLTDDSRIRRFGDGEGSRVGEVLEGFRARNSEMIARALESIFVQMHG
mgnify:CR=1 FL=1